jgi:hypothetical protein
MKIEVQHEETSDIIELVYHIIQIRKTVKLPEKKIQALQISLVFTMA